MIAETQKHIRKLELELRERERERDLVFLQSWERLDRKMDKEQMANDNMQMTNTCLLLSILFLLLKIPFFNKEIRVNC